MSMTVENSESVSEQYFGHIKYASGEHDFKLDANFLASYSKKKPNFGFNGLGEFVFYRTYSRVKEDGKKESFLDTIRRVVEGCYEIQRRHCRKIHIPWDYDKAQRSAQEMFERMWNFKFLPPGRGLWMMGTDFMWERGSAALNNCAFVSTDDRIESDPAEPFCFLMDMSMLGVGVGFDTKGAGKIFVHEPEDGVYEHVVDDSREGWVDSVRVLIWSYTKNSGMGRVRFNYDNIRKAGSEIRGFGGKASGPEILKDLHSLVRDHFERKIGTTLTSVDITDLMNYIGRCVVAGNVRRTAEIAFGEPDDQSYCSMKNPLATLLESDYKAFYDVTGKIYARGSSHASIEDFIGEDGSLTISEDRLKPAIETWNALNHHRWASNNSIFAYIGMDYKYVGQQIASNGEPGLMWLDNMRDYGRLIDGRQPGIDGRVKGGNPCFAGSVRLLTEHGYINMHDLWVGGGCQEYIGTDDSLSKYGSQKIINKNGLVEASNVYRTGTQVPVFRVTFDDNAFIDLTDNHNMIVLVRHSSKKKGKTKYVEERKMVKELSVGDMVPLNQVSHFGDHHDPAYGELAGWVIGDGSLSPREDGQTKAECTCYETDCIDVLPRISGLLHETYLNHNKSTNQKPMYAGWTREHKHFEHWEERVGSSVLGRLLVADGLRSGDKHKIPFSIWRSTRETVAAFLKGFASADGFVLINEKKKTISVRIKQSNERLLQDCRLLLSQFGIASSVHLRAEESMNDGKGGEDRKPSYELIVSGIKQVKSFLNQIGFIQDWKTAEARKWLLSHHGSHNSDTGNYVRVKSIDYIGVEDTYCLTEPANNRVVVEGYEVGQCLEQSLESYELCNLVESFPANHENADDYMRTLKFAYLYAKTVTLLPTHNPRTNQVTLRNRRIGLSQSGIAQAFAKFGRRSMLKDFCDAGYNEIRRWDNIYSEWLCVQNSIKVTSVKPSGSVSLVVGATPGIHYPEASTYWRRVRLAKDSPLVGILEKAGFHIEPDVKDEERTVVVRFGVSDERVRPVAQVSIWEQVANVVDYQRYWADNQVSCTVKFKPEDADQIFRVLETFEDQLKGISFLPLYDHGYAQAPYEACKESEVAEYNSKITDTDYSDFIGQDAEGAKFCDSDKCVIV